MIVLSRVMWYSIYWLVIKMIIINVTIMVIMVSDNTNGCL